MTSLLTDDGLRIAAFDPVLAAVLGNKDPGGNVLAVAIEHGRAQVQLRDWFYCLVRAPGTVLRKRFVDALGQEPRRLIQGIEDAMDTDDEPKGGLLTRLTSAVVSADVMRMLEVAEKLAQTHQCERITDQILTLALWEVADEVLKDLLTSWISEDGIKRFLADLRPRPKEVSPLFREKDGQIDRTLFDKSGWKLCSRMLEDAASMAAPRISTRHLLYSLLGDESSSLHVALALQGVDVKRDLHARLTRELTRGVKKRNDALVLSKPCLFDATEGVLKEAQSLAGGRGAPRIAEPDIALAFLSKQLIDVRRLLPEHAKVDLAAVRDYLELRQAEPEEEGEPIKQLTVDEIATRIKERILGQDAAVDSIIPWIKRLRFGLRRDSRPAAVFLFLGPTGAGKTQLAKELARYVFGDPERIIFIEMGQFKTKESMNNLVGASPGYVGYGEGKLTNGLRDMPEGIVLFDEIEKADTQVFDTILRFADEGLISDPAGPVRDGRKCIIVMTTNAGQEWLRDHLKSESEGARKPVREIPSNSESQNVDRSGGAWSGQTAQPSLREDPGLGDKLFNAADRELRSKGFRPEFLGRLDQKVTFLPFTVGTCRRIVDQVLEGEIAKFAEHNVEIQVRDEGRNVLANLTYERSLDEGARGAPRAINERIVAPAIDLLTANQNENGTFAVSYIEFVVNGAGEIVCGAEQ